MNIRDTVLTEFLSQKCDTKAFAALAKAKTLRTPLSPAEVAAIQETSVMVFNKPVSLSSKERQTLQDSFKVMQKLSPSSTFVTIQLKQNSQ